MVSIIFPNNLPQMFPAFPQPSLAIADVRVGDLLILISLFHVLILLQFLAASKGQPRLALLVNTLEKAFQDIVHLSLGEMIMVDMLGRILEMMMLGKILGEMMMLGR